MASVLLGKLAVTRSVAGQGAARWLLEWAFDHAKQCGNRELRLGCWAGNERLRRYYTEAGTNLSESRTYACSRFVRRD